MKARHSRVEVLGVEVSAVTLDGASDRRCPSGPGVLAPGVTLNELIIGMVAYGNGYVQVAGDGGVFVFSDQPFAGSLGTTPPNTPIVAIAPIG